VERCLFTRSRSDNLSSSQILREDRATTTCYTCCLGVCTSTITVYSPHSGLTDVVFGHRSSATASETTAPSPSTPPPSLSTWLSGEPPPSPPCQGCYPCLAGARTASPTTRCRRRARACRATTATLHMVTTHTSALGTLRRLGRSHCLGRWARPNQRPWAESRAITMQLFLNSFSFL
jgi:hypothetical protein